MVGGKSFGNTDLNSNVRATGNGGMKDKEGKIKKKVEKQLSMEK